MKPIEFRILLQSPTGDTVWAAYTFRPNQDDDFDTYRLRVIQCNENHGFRCLQAPNP